MEKLKRYLSDLQKTLDRLPLERIELVIQILRAARLENRQVFIMGNGGSASTATHFVCDLGKNTRVSGWTDFRVIGLTDNMAIFSAYSNDEGYENALAQQLASLVQPEDVVIGISTSGNSPNVLNAIVLANSRQATTIGFTGFDGGELSSLVDVDVHVPSDCIEHVEDIHLALEHMITKALREMAKEEEVFEHPVSVQIPGSRMTGLREIEDENKGTSGVSDAGSLVEVEVGKSL